MTGNPLSLSYDSPTVKKERWITRTQAPTFYFTKQRPIFFYCYQVDSGAQWIREALSSEIKWPKWETDQSPQYTAETTDVRTFTLTNLRIFTTCCLLTATTLPTVKLLHLIYGMRRFYNGDCERYVPLDVTLPDRNSPIFGRNVLSQSLHSLETSENFYHTTRLYIPQYGNLPLLCILTKKDHSVWKHITVHL
jgi:hypothetical protein